MSKLAQSGHTDQQIVVTRNRRVDLFRIF